MSLNINKLENVKYRGSNFTARCPACAEIDTDKKGNHLSVDGKGRFTCIIYPQNHGIDHRKRIFALVGIPDNTNKYHYRVIEVKKINKEKMGNIIKRDILGHLGHLNQTPYKSETDILGDLGHLGRLNQTPYKSIDNFQDAEKDVPVSLKSTDKPQTIKKFCKCGHVATVYEFGKTETGKRDWMFWCSTCNPYMSYCSECDNPAIPYINKFGWFIEDKCNVHGAKHKVTYGMIRQFSDEKRYLQIEQGLIDRCASLPITDFRSKNIVKAKNCLKTACTCGKQATMFYLGKNKKAVNTWISHCDDCDTSNPKPKIKKQLAQETLTLASDPIVLIKRRVIEVCTPLGAAVKVTASCHGNLAVHKIPNTEKTAWTITHIPTGFGIVHGLAPFVTRVEAHQVVSKLLALSDWHIQGAKWGYLPPGAVRRIEVLWKMINMISCLKK